MDTSVCMESGENTLTEFYSGEKFSRHILLLDNLEAYTKDDFKKLVNSLSRVVWYGLPNATDLWQPVDAGYAQVLISLISIEHREWLEFDNNTDSGFVMKNYSVLKERRIIISNWAGNASGKLLSSRYDHLRRQCWIKTGCLISADGSNDNFIKQEGLSNYDVVPPSCLDPSSKLVVNNPVPDEQHHESDAVLFNEDTELTESEVAEDAKECNIFDFFDELC